MEKFKNKKQVIYLDLSGPENLAHKIKMTLLCGYAVMPHAGHFLFNFFVA
jgi:hypothetical protein